MQRRDVGDDAIDVDDAVVAQPVREDPLPHPALDAVVAAQPVLELEWMQQALVGVAEQLVVALAIVRVNRGEPLLIRLARASAESPSSERDGVSETSVTKRSSGCVSPL